MSAEVFVFSNDGFEAGGGLVVFPRAIATAILVYLRPELGKLG